MPKVSASPNACENGQATKVLSAPRRHRLGRLSLRDRDDASYPVVRAYQDGFTDVRKGRDDPDVCHRIAPAGRRCAKREDGYRSHLVDDEAWSRSSNARAWQDGCRGDGNRFDVYGNTSLVVTHSHLIRVYSPYVDSLERHNINVIWPSIISRPTASIAASRISIIERSSGTSRGRMTNSTSGLPSPRCTTMIT